MDNLDQKTSQFKEVASASNPSRLYSFLSKNIRIVLVLIIGIFVLAGIYVLLVLEQSKQPQSPTNQLRLSLSPTPDPTANWQTYRNEEFGFEVRYPDEFGFKEDGKTVVLTSLPVSHCFSGEEDLGESYELLISFRNYTGNSFSDIWKQAFGFEFKEGNYDGVKTIGKRNAYYFYQSAEMPFARIAYLVPHSENSAIQIDTFYQNYLLNCLPKFTRTNEEVREIEDQILSTFRFIE